MVKISVNHLETDMVLARDLFAPNGRFMLPGGAHIRKEYTNTLKSWGISEVDIQGGENMPVPPMPDVSNPEVLRSCETYLKDIFSLNDSKDCTVAELCRISRSFAIDSVEHGESLPSRMIFIESRNAFFEKKDLDAQRSISAFDLISGEISLSSLTNVYYQIVEVLNSPRSSASHIADVVSKDTSLSARLLKLVNSAFYSFPSKIRSISQAVAIIGTDELGTLALGVAAIEHFRDMPSDLVNMRAFWKHAICCGIFARLLATRKRLITDNRFFLAGMLLDIGHLVMFRKIPAFAVAAMVHSRKNGLPLFESERLVIGYNHAFAGSLLMKEWRLPQDLTDVIRYHHTPSAAPDPLNASIIHIAEMLSVALGCGENGSWFVPPLDRKAWDLLGLSCNDLEPIALQGRRQMSEIVSAFLDGGIS